MAGSSSVKDSKVRVLYSEMLACVGHKFLYSTSEIVSKDKVKV
jgi:hypothetical protein